LGKKPDAISASDYEAAITRLRLRPRSIELNAAA